MEVNNAISFHNLVVDKIKKHENFSFDYKEATTPSIQSQLRNSTRTNLFKVKTRSHGTNMNTKYRVGISNVKRPDDVVGSDYGSFDLQVIVNNPGQNDDGTVLENFQNLTFDEDNVNFLPRAIGSLISFFLKLGVLNISLK